MDEAIQAMPFPVIVVTGAIAGQVSASIHNKNVIIVYNKDWNKGMGSGIAIGISKLGMQDDRSKAAIIAVCDQPFVSAELFQNLIQKKEKTGKGIVACAYGNAVGTPVLFDKLYFNQLQDLGGTEGAKLLLKKYSDDVATLQFPEGIFDIDTENDYRNLFNDKIQRK